MRRKISVLSLVFLVLCSFSFAQYKTVVFNYEKSQFNDGGFLPAESYMLLSGTVNRQVTMVEVSIYSSQGSLRKTPKYSKLWKREFVNQTERFELPLNYKLKGNSVVDVHIDYYRFASAEEVKNARIELFTSLDAYIDQNLKLNRKDIDLLKSGGGLVDDLNAIASSSMKYYKSQTGYEFRGFSDLVLDKINLISKSKQNRFLGKKVSEEKNLSLKEKQINELKIRVHSEVSHLFNSQLSVLADSKFIDDYVVEKTPNFLTIHVGYGGVSLSEEISNNSFGTSPMIGLSFPLRNAALSGGVLSKTSVMFGVYTNNFVSENGYTITGPLIKRPIYLGLAYKVFQFINISGGVAMLENDLLSNDPRNFKENVYFRPYVGISADFNLFLQLGR